jgi:hypothetical protein
MIVGDGMESPAFLGVDWSGYPFSANGSKVFLENKPTSSYTQIKTHSYLKKNIDTLFPRSDLDIALFVTQLVVFSSEIFHCLLVNNPKLFEDLKKKSIEFFCEKCNNNLLKGSDFVDTLSKKFLPFYDQSNEIYNSLLYILAQPSLYYDKRISSFISLLGVQLAPLFRITPLSLFTSSAIIGIYRLYNLSI